MGGRVVGGESKLEGEKRRRKKKKKKRGGAKERILDREKRGEHKEAGEPRKM